VRQKQGLIEHPESEVVDQKAHILQNISLINALLEENKQKIEQLQSSSKLLNSDKKAIQRLFDQARASMQLQSEQILKLKQDLAFEEFKVADLNVMMDELQVQNEQLQSEKDNLVRVNSQLDQDVNTVYFVYGNETELKEKEMLNSRPVLRTQKGLLSPHFNRNRAFFAEFDLRKLTEIPIKGKDAKVLTLHPEDSYVWEQTSKDYGKLKILDSVAFWSISRYLVVLVKN
jgi:cytochrome c biogenesis protein ResB